MRRIDDLLAGITRLGLDTAPIIYLVEANAHYDARVRAAFKHIAEGRSLGITSVITLAEALIHPLRAGDHQLEREYVNLLLRTPNIRIRSVGPDVVRRAAELRARYGIRLPDALQVATALRGRCQAFLTNDAHLRRVTELNVLVLDELTA